MSDCCAAVASSLPACSLPKESSSQYTVLLFHEYFLTPLYTIATSTLGISYFLDIPAVSVLPVPQYINRYLVFYILEVTHVISSMRQPPIQDANLYYVSLPPFNDVSSLISLQSFLPIFIPKCFHCCFKCDLIVSEC